MGLMGHSQTTFYNKGERGSGGLRTKLDGEGEWVKNSMNIRIERINPTYYGPFTATPDIGGGGAHKVPTY